MQFIISLTVLIKFSSHVAMEMAIIKLVFTFIYLFIFLHKVYFVEAFLFLYV